MGKSVSQDQSHAVIAVLQSNVNWDVLDGDILQEQIIRRPREAGEHFTLFLKRGARVNVQHGWREKEGVIYLTVISDGTTGPDWIKRLEKEGFRPSRWAEDVLGSPDFKPTKDVIYQIAVLKATLFTDSHRITKKIRAEAGRRNIEKPHAEVACLIRENFSDEQLKAMGLWWIVVFHEPIKDSGGDPGLLGASRDNEGRWLGAYYDRPDDLWNSDSGFAFALP